MRTRAAYHLLGRNGLELHHLSKKESRSIRHVDRNISEAVLPRIDVSLPSKPGLAGSLSCTLAPIIQYSVGQRKNRVVSD